MGAFADVATPSLKDTQAGSLSFPHDGYLWFLMLIASERRLHIYPHLTSCQQCANSGVKGLKQGIDT